MKKNYLHLLMFGLLSCSSAFAQQQIEDSYKQYEPIIPERKQQLLKDMDVIANMRFGFNNYSTNGVYDQSKFQNDQFRLEFRGKVSDKVSFRWRDRYTRSQTISDLDNLSRTTDLAYVQLELNDRSYIRAGKMCADWGGVEFDLNPIDVYEYNDIVEYADNFLSGFQYTYKVGAEKKHEFSLQLLNSRTQTLATLYPTMKDSFAVDKFAAAYNVNWRGSMFNDKWQTIWSYSVFQEANMLNMNYIALGNTFNISKKLQVNYDFKLSDEDLDRKTIVTDMAKKGFGDQKACYQDSRYLEHWLQINYRFAEKWGIALIGMSSRASWRNAPDQSGDVKLRDSYGFIPSIEYYPYKDLNIRFFVNYIGRYYQYSDYAKSHGMDSGVNKTERVNIGFIAPLLIL